MTNIIHDFGQILLCVYAVVKHGCQRIFLKYNKGDSVIISIICELLYIVTSLLLYTAILLLLLPFVIIRKLVDIYLRMKHGRKYCGLLTHLDALWTAENDEAKHIINSLMFIELRNSPEHFLLYVKQKIIGIGGTQFNTTLHEILRYWYRLHSDTVVNDVLKLIVLTSDERSSKAKFEEKISKLSNQALPESSPFEILISSEPITFYGTTNSETSTYVVIIRLHHTVGDGTGLLSFLLTSMADQENNLKVNQISSYYKGNSENVNELSIYPKFTVFKSVNQIFEIVKNASIYYFGPLEQSDNNILHGPILQGEKILVFHIEQESTYISKIKSIKNQFEDCRFSDVLYTAISASLWEHFSSHDTNIPKDIHISFISTSFQNLRNEKNQTSNSNFCAMALDIPIQIDGATTKQHLIKRLKTIIARNKALRQSLDAAMFYWLYRHMYFLPINILKPLKDMNLKSTVTFSNLPGIESVKVDGQRVKDVVFWTPHVCKVGFGLTVLSYDGRLQIGLSVDAVLIPTKEKALTIVENVCKYIDLLAEEINCK